MAENIIAGPHFERTIYLSIGELLFATLKENGEHIAVIDARSDKKISANLLLNRAIALSKWFRRNNIRSGDRISISSENNVEFSVILVATLMCGITVAPHNPEYKQGELQHVINLSKPKIIFCSPSTINGFMSIKNNFPYIQTIVLCGNVRSTFEDVVMYEDIIKDARVGPIDEDFRLTPINPDENVAIILCSSGTTGLPKGVMLTHFNMTFNLELRRLEKGNDNQIVTGLVPFFHGLGFMTLLYCLLELSTIVVYSKFEPTVFLESISKYKVTRLVIPPTMIVFLTNHPTAKNYFSTVTNIRCGAASLSKYLQNEFSNKFKQANLYQNYGMTETTLGVLKSLGIPYKAGSVGKIVPGMKCKIIDKNGTPLGSNKTGELCFQGPLIMRGYVDDTNATANTIDEDNWLHTGDIGYYDHDGYFFIVGRIKELIKYKGFQVAPAELEALLQNHPAVLEAAVVGLKDERTGELPLAFIVRRPNYNVTETELQDYVASKVSSAKRLRGGVRFIETLPRNAAGKVMKYILSREVNKLHSKL